MSGATLLLGRIPGINRPTIGAQFPRPDGGYTLVFDANQEYSVDQARRLSDTLATDPFGRLLWFEQPVDRRDWDAMSRVCADASVPIVLDECIYTAHDIDQARSHGHS